MGRVYWAEFFDKMENCYNELSKLPWKIIGKISFSASDDSNYMYNVIDDIEIDDSMTVDDHEGNIEVIKELQKGMIFRYFLAFRSYEYLYIEQEMENDMFK
uniref:Uncharacterized protein n=1 Tax=Panagrolaimus sp. PS1159 TaxID=55785 RepID=A0AC35EWX7_9BILA